MSAGCPRHFSFRYLSVLVGVEQEYSPLCLKSIRDVSTSSVQVCHDSCQFSDTCLEDVSYERAHKDCRCLTVEFCRSAHLDEGQRLPLLGHIHILPLIMILCCDTACACLQILKV